MTPPTDRELVDHWRREPAPLLPLLHALHERDGYLSDAALRAVAKGLGIPLADLFGTVTFYHHFSRTPEGRAAPRVCDGPVCRLHGCDDVLRAQRPRGARAMPCAGRCDDPVPVLAGDHVFTGDATGALASRPSPLPPPPPPALPGGDEECVFAHVRTPGRATLEGYRATGGFRALTLAVRELTPADVLERVTQSGLAGRGGAGFPTGRKWRAVADAPGAPRTLVCNADEGEPGCFKDRALMDLDPFALVEGIVLAAYATGATRGFIYLRYEYPDTAHRLEAALAAARAAGLLGPHVLESPFSFDLYVRRGAGAYICGEETSLLNSLEGRHPFPRNRPPFPVTHGFENLPTVVNNVETLCSVPPILVRGPEWYKALGRGGHAGTKVISLSGDISRPGNYEVPLGFPLRTLLYERAGGPLPGRRLRAVTMAGLSGGFLGERDFDVTLDEPSLRSRGSFLGAGGVMVFDDRRDMVEVARQAMSFFAHESCGKCFPCRIGTQRLTERLGGEAGGRSLVDPALPGPRGRAEWTAEVQDIGRTMKATSACGLGMAAPLVTESLLRHFADDVAARFATRDDR